MCETFFTTGTKLKKLYSKKKLKKKKLFSFLPIVKTQPRERKKGREREDQALAADDIAALAKDGGLRLKNNKTCQLNIYQQKVFYRKHLWSKILYQIIKYIKWCKGV